MSLQHVDRGVAKFVREPPAPAPPHSPPTWLHAREEDRDTSATMGGLLSHRERYASAKHNAKLMQSVKERPFRKRPSTNTYKLLLVGDEKVGKTSLSARFAEDHYGDDETYRATIGVDFHVRKVNLDGEEYRVQLFDTAGGKRFRELTKTYFMGADGVVIVYSAADQSTFKSVEYWLRLVARHCRIGTELVLLGNKCDDGGGKVVEYSVVKEFAEEKKIPFFEVSAKDGTNVELAFLALVHELQEADKLLPASKR